MGKEQFTIARIFGAYYEIYSEATTYALAVLKGKLRLKNSDERHPFVVGDIVLAEKSSGEEWVISERMERKNYLTRKSDKGDIHVLCANLDQVAILASCKDPETKPGFIDRLLAASYHTAIPPLIIFTKKDLVSEEEIEDRETYYKELGYEVMSVSLLSEESIQPLWEKIKGKRTFLCGNSGVGKSTLMNHLHQKTVQRTNLVSGSTKKGKHTTTNSFALFLEGNTVLIDSPGVKEWGILHLTTTELWESFPELRNVKERCQEIYCCELGSNCPMRQYMEETMDETRKKSLESMIESLENPHRVTRRDHWTKAVTKRY
ncbi:ribosome small subunit-dependent GTPase A [Leptospira jelokensis]|uniref:Small ribosomal subunit biogenesis GTPase RsgA n=1 Tax=Leptospira jelokensis TaxID=2484931 RepID=A0A4Z0ZZ81_9LEPT|nr:ribosome small subunit-dependent GTPase A [Leptospira jelokensis]TGL56913.1 ribosome small subunit-dependent GTPase A [Leptospira jelokensis]